MSLMVNSFLNGILTSEKILGIDNEYHTGKSRLEL